MTPVRWQKVMSLQSNTAVLAVSRDYALRRSTWCCNYRHIIAHTNCIPMRERLVGVEARRAMLGLPRGRLLFSARVPRYGLSVTHRPDMSRADSSPRRIKNSRCNDRYFSTGHRARARARGRVLSNGNGLAKRKSVGRSKGNQPPTGMGCETDKNLYGTGWLRTGTRSSSVLHVIDCLRRVLNSRETSVNAGYKFPSVLFWDNE